MRRFFTLFMCVFAVSFVNAQFVISPLDTSYSGTLVNQMDNQEIEGAVLYSGSSSDTIGWRVDSLSAPDGWEMSLCDKNNCYIFYPSSPNLTVYEFAVAPSSSNLFRYGVNPYCAAGTGFMGVTVWQKSDSAATVTHATFTATYTGECGTSAIKETMATNVRVYPTAFESHIMVESGDAKLNAIKLYNTLGSLTKEVKVANSNTANIETSNLASGVYIVRVETAKGVFSQRVVKQ